jgi:hypothetical protein
MVTSSNSCSRTPALCEESPTTNPVAITSRLAHTVAPTPSRGRERSRPPAIGPPHRYEHCHEANSRCATAGEFIAAIPAGCGWRRRRSDRRRRFTVVARFHHFRHPDRRGRRHADSRRGRWLDLRFRPPADGQHTRFRPPPATVHHAPHSPSAATLTPADCAMHSLL